MHYYAFMQLQQEQLEELEETSRYVSVRSWGLSQGDKAGSGPFFASCLQHREFDFMEGRRERGERERERERGMTFHFSLFLS